MTQEFYIVKIGNFYVSNIDGSKFYIEDSDEPYFVVITSFEANRDLVEAKKYSLSTAESIAQIIGGQVKKITVEIED